MPYFGVCSRFANRGQNLGLSESGASCGKLIYRAF